MVGSRMIITKFYDQSSRNSVILSSFHQTFPIILKENICIEKQKCEIRQFITSSAYYVSTLFISSAEHFGKSELKEPSPLARLNPKFQDVITLRPAVMYR